MTLDLTSLKFALADLVDKADALVAHLGDDQISRKVVRKKKTILPNGISLIGTAVAFVDTDETNAACKQ